MRGRITRKEDCGVRMKTNDDGDNDDDVDDDDNNNIVYFVHN